MTTAIESTPVVPTETILAEIPKEPVEVKPEAKAPAKEKPASMFDGLKVITPHTPEEPVKEEPKKEEKKEGSAKADEPKVEDKAAPNRDNFKRLEEAKKLAIEQTAQQKKEIEALRKQLADDKAEALRESEAIRQENQKMHSELRTAAIERDPEFQEKYVKAESRRVGELKELAVAAGYTEKQFDTAFARGDDEILSEIEGTLDASQKRKWNNHLSKIEEIRDEKSQAIAESEKTWKELQTKHKQAHSEQAKETIARNSQFAEAAIEEILKMAPGIENDTETMDEVREVLFEVAGARENSAQWTTQQILKTVGESKILARAVVNLGKVAQEDKARIAELEEKLAEAEGFVKNQTASAPRGNGSSAGAVKVEEGSMLSRLSVKIPGR